MTVVVPGATLLSTNQLVTVARNAIQDGMEHLLLPDTVNAVDPSPLAHHVLALRGVLDQRNGQECEPFARCVLLVRTVEGDGREQSHMDVRLRDYLQLRPAEPGDGFPVRTFQRTFSQHDLTPDGRTP